VANISSALIFGAIFWRLKRKQSSIQDRLGLLQVRSRKGWGMSRKESREEGGDGGGQE
jgi:hypothetical protein